MDLTTRDPVDELLQTYSETGGINYLDAAATLAIEAACADLMSLMFPGFRSEALVSSEDLTKTTRTRIRNLQARLKNEFCRSLRKIPPDETTEKRADEILRCFLSELPRVRKMLWKDIDAAKLCAPRARGKGQRITRRLAPLVLARAPHRIGFACSLEATSKIGRISCA